MIFSLQVVLGLRMLWFQVLLKLGPIHARHISGWQAACLIAVAVQHPGNSSELFPDCLKVILLHLFYATVAVIESMR